MNCIVSSLLEKLENEINGYAKSDFIIFGSAAIVMHGVDLGREVSDLDVFVSEDIFRELSSQFTEDIKLGNDGDVPFYAPYENIEILKSFPGVTFDQVKMTAQPLAGFASFPVGSLAYLKTWKMAQGRSKDIADIEKIDAHAGSDP